MTSTFYNDIETQDIKILELLEEIKEISEITNRQIYVIGSPLAEKKYEYSYDKALAVLIPNHNIIFFNIGTDENLFEEYCEDFLEDLGHISDKYEYKEILGRPRKWKEDYFQRENWLESHKNLSDLFNENKLEIDMDKRKVELLISLLIGSINSIEKIGTTLPDNILDKIKRKIVLFDSDQTQFIFKKVNKKRIVIQGLAGTGKTELLLHKLKELYTENSEPKVVFTCHNRSLANKLKSRVPEFFTFMKVEEQIKWENRLWVMHSWGSRKDHNNIGLYSVICKKYGLSFSGAGKASFEKACKDALNELEELPDFVPCFDYILIDESQDFDEAFFQLCEKVTTKTVYIAGDIFQNIFRDTLPEVSADFLLNKCYRTDSRTLMFAHALGLGILERPVLRWLTDDEWKACGYIVNIHEDEYKLSRNILRRFEDIRKDEVSSVELLRAPHNNCRKEIIDVISNIKHQNPSVTAEDIAIIFVDTPRNVYDIMDDLSIMISNEFNWKTNLVHNTKKNIENALFISTKNNVKGLEFPFVICVANYKISAQVNSRNALYMSLTRSFITSYLIISEDQNREVLPILEHGLQSINTNDALLLKKPREDEILDREALLIQTETTLKSQREIVNDIFENLKIPAKSQDKLRDIVSILCEDSVDENDIRKVISNNIGSIK